MRLETAETKFPHDPVRQLPNGKAEKTRVRPCARAAILNWQFPGLPPFVPEKIEQTVTAYAEVNHGRWIVHCPWCYGAEMAAETDKFFFCAHCLNDEVGGALIPVVWPSNAREIEDELIRRPNDRGRHWLPTESMAQLRTETDLMLQMAEKWQQDNGTLEERLRGRGKGAVSTIGTIFETPPVLTPVPGKRPVDPGVV